MHSLHGNRELSIMRYSRGSQVRCARLLNMIFDPTGVYTIINLACQGVMMWCVTLCHCINIPCNTFTCHA